MPARPQIAPTEDWRQIELLARAPGQRTDELIRPVVLFGQSAAERPAELHHIFYSTRFGRVLDRAGYARFRRWRVYAERGLGGEPVAVWPYGEHLTLVYQDEPLAQYRVAYHPDQRRLQMVTPEQLFETPHRSPQPPLWTWGEDAWLPVLRLPAYAPRKSRPPGAVQPPLFAREEVSA